MQSTSKYLIAGIATAGLAFTTPHPTSIRYSTWMLNSIISRGQGIVPSDGLLGEIQNGIFQEAIRAAIEWSKDEAEPQHSQWIDYYYKSVNYNLTAFTNAAADAESPLDRFCAGRSLIQSQSEEEEASVALAALRKSVDLQPRNSNGGLWYFADPPPPEIPYSNVSYNDGMYGFAPFAVLYGTLYNDENVNFNSVLQQFEILYNNTVRYDSGLLVHGYDASKRAPWADQITGASPEVWGRSLAWYTTGLIDALTIAERSPSLTSVPQYYRLKDIFHRLASAEMKVIRDSASQTSRYGIWQVVDQPGKAGNFVEASATAMILYALGKGQRYGYIGSHNEDVNELLCATYADIINNFVVANANGTLDYDGTSELASLFVQSPDYEYYVSRTTVNNSLIGSSAFVLASLEVEDLCMK